MSINERYRPKYHFTAPQNWINDPNGLVQWQGRYHLYYQHNPGAAYWGDMHWGHAVSRDLLNWEHLPIALFPDEEYDHSGAYSGIAVNDGDEVNFIYTGVNDGQQLPCLAVASDALLLHPTKSDFNPLFYPPGDLDLVIFRDHAIAKRNDIWYQVIGSGIRGEGGNCMLYRSEDLMNWEFLHALVLPELLVNEDPSVTGWECPDFFAIGDTWVLIVSHWNGDPIRVWAYTGTFNGNHFVPLHGSIVDAGLSFYAPQSFTDNAGRRIQIGWLRETRPVEHHTADGWAGAMSLPREMIIRADGTLGMKPVQEVLDALNFRPIGDFSSGEWGDIDLGDISSTSNVIRISSEEALDFGLELFRSQDGREVTSISAAGGVLRVDTTGSSSHGEIPGEAFTSPIGDASEVLIFVDESVIELYVAEQGHTVRVYPVGEDATGLRLRSAHGATLEVSPFDVQFTMNAAD